MRKFIPAYCFILYASLILKLLQFIYFTIKDRDIFIQILLHNECIFDKLISSEILILFKFLNKNSINPYLCRYYPRLIYILKFE